MPLSITLHTGPVTRNGLLAAQRKHRDIIKTVQGKVDCRQEPFGRQNYLKMRQARGERIKSWDVPLAGKRMWSHASLTFLHDRQKKHERLVQQALDGKRLGIPKAVNSEPRDSLM